MSSQILPLGITMGCPAGIGPEIIIQNFLKTHNSIPYVILGDTGVLEKAAQALKVDITIRSWCRGDALNNTELNVLELSQLDLNEHQWGTPYIAGGKAMANYITQGVELIQQGVLSGLVTCPIAKSTLNAAGFHFPGHTEMLESLSGGHNVAMMMAGERLKVTLVTLHTALDNVAKELSSEKILQMIKTTHKSLCVDFAFDAPRLAIAALNPHAGEGGLFGNEESLLLQPAIDNARKMGIDISDPLPPDTVFFKAAAGEFDAVICMYHDQGLIPFKLLHFEDGVNVTLGLDIVRTSVDHGTAYDIAGTGVASHISLTAAITLAHEIVCNRYKG